MPVEIEESGAVRQEIWGLLQQQMEVLGSSEELTDHEIIECYARQMRVQHLREQLEAHNSGNPSKSIQPLPTEKDKCESQTLSPDADSLATAA